MFKNRLKLNDEQRLAVETTEGPVRVVAGAGTGKTRTLTGRYVYLCEELGIPAGNILCVTFTNRAAGEMKKRVRELIGEKDTGYICTFHSLGLQILKEDITALNWPAGFTVLDAEDKEALLSTVFSDMNITMKEMTLKWAAGYTEDKKIDMKYVDWLMGNSIDALREKMVSEPDRKLQMFYRYLYEQRKIYALDFEDLVDAACALLLRNEAVRKKWQERFEYILVDEFQDIDRMQYLLMDILSKGSGNLFVVGDPDQTIYTWRGADVHYILDFPEKYKGAETLLLEENYRSTPEILKLSNTLIEKNKQRVKRNLKPFLPSGGKPKYYHAEDAQKEAKYIAGRITELVKAGTAYDSVAILYRAHYISRSIEDAFIAAKIPYVIWGGTAFYARKEIKDALCYMRMAVRGDDLAFLRTVNEPRRGVGKKRIALIREYAEAHSVTLYEAMKACLDDPLLKTSHAAEYAELVEKYRDYGSYSLSELMKRLLSESGYTAALKAAGDGERLDNIAELLQSIEEYEKNAGEKCEAEDYLNETALFTDRDREDKKDTVRLMTVHNAKGLEFDHVIVCGLNEGMFPTRRTDSWEKMEEERRLCYVACTRARKTLTLTEASGFTHEGTVRYPSRFLDDMGEENYETLVPVPRTEKSAGRRLRLDTEEKLKGHAPLYVPGTKVEHPVFGEGEILSIDTAASCCRVRFLSGKERNISFDGPLRRI